MPTDFFVHEALEFCPVPDVAGEDRTCSQHQRAQLGMQGALHIVGRLGVNARKSCLKIG